MEMILGIAIGACVVLALAILGLNLLTKRLLMFLGLDDD